MNHQAAFSKFVCERNIERYERMLHTPLTNLERDFIQRRVAEERQALAQLVTKNDATTTTPKLIGAFLAPDLLDYFMSTFDLAAQVGTALRLRSGRLAQEANTTPASVHKSSLLARGTRPLMMC